MNVALMKQSEIKDAVIKFPWIAFHFIEAKLA